MKRLLIAALLVTSLPALADHDYDERHSHHDDDRDDRDRDDRDRMERPIVMDQDDLRGQLDDLSKIIDDIASEPSSRKRARLVARAREQLDEIRKDVREASSVDRNTWRSWHQATAGNNGYGQQQQQQQPPPQVVVVQQPPPQQQPPVVLTSPPPLPPNGSTPPPGQGTYQAPPQGTYAVANPELENIKASLRREAFGRDRLRVLDGAARNNYFYVAQVQQLLPLFDFSNDRLAAVKLLRPHIMDMQNGYQLYASFEYANDKAELKRILGQ